MKRPAPATTTEMFVVRAKLIPSIFALLFALLAMPCLLGAYVLALAGGLEGPALVFLPLLTFFAVGFVLSRLTRERHAVSVTVGEDGVYAALGSSSQLVPFAAIEHVYNSRREMIVRIRDRKSLRFGFDPDRIAIGPLVERIQEGRRAATSNENVSDAEPLLERGNRTTSDWISAVRTLVERRSFREAGVDPDQLWRIVEDAASEPAHRAAAAIGLASTLDPAGKTRLRVAAEASAHPAVRVALDAVAAADDEASFEDEKLAHALDDL